MAYEERAPIAAVQPTGIAPGWLRRALGALVVALIAIAVLAVLVVFATRSAWQLLGVGRGLVSPEFYPYSGLLVLLGTTLGQFAGWAGGSALLVYLWRRLTQRPLTPRVVQVAVSLVYLGMAVLPILVYHVLFGPPLAGLPRPGLEAWVRTHHPDAYALLFPGHRVVDFSVIPLAIAVLALVWSSKERLVRHFGLQTLVLFLILATSFAVALSLAIHSTLVHIRLG
ncbi:MAG: hypothetical protein KatS3mg131_0567 [Candidatus Tectimicrobiota bacterium]|nr:MAG: hypothetical protein KatS3mg131_0567 [Candidatus Tectomicrobia bacterium]